MGSNQVLALRSIVRTEFEWPGQGRVNPYGKYAFEVSEYHGGVKLQALRPGRLPAWRSFCPFAAGSPIPLPDRRAVRLDGRIATSVAIDGEGVRWGRQGGRSARRVDGRGRSGTASIISWRRSTSSRSR